MRKILLCLGVVIFPIFLYSQNNSIFTVSPPYKFIETNKDYHEYKQTFTNKDNSKSLLIKKKDSYLYFQSFDNKTLRELKRSKIKIHDELSSSSIIVRIAYLGDKLYSFHYRWEADLKKWSFKCREIDFEQCKFVGREKVLFNSDKYPNSNMFSLDISEDKSKLIIYYEEYQKKVKNTEKFDNVVAYIFDSDLMKITYNSLKLPHSENNFKGIQYRIANDGNFYIVGEVLKEEVEASKKKRKKIKKIHAHFELLKLDFVSPNLHNSPLELDSDIIQNIGLFQGPEMGMLLAGCFKSNNLSNTNELFYQGNPKGYYIIKINEDGQLSEGNKYKIPTQLLNRYSSLSEKPKNNQGLSNLKVKKLCVQEDKSIVLVGEQITYQQSKVKSDDGQVIFLYSYDDIIICKIDSKNELDWIKKLPKKQRGNQFSKGLGFNYQKLNDSHCIIYIDNVKNRTLQEDQAPVRQIGQDEGYLVMYKLDDQNGSEQKDFIFDTKKIPVEKVNASYRLYNLRIENIIKVFDDSFILEFYKKNQEDVLVKVRVK